MRITKSKLKQLVKEELQKTLGEDLLVENKDQWIEAIVKSMELMSELGIASRGLPESWQQQLTPLRLPINELLRAYGQQLQNM